MKKIIKNKTFWLSFGLTALVIFTALFNFYRVSKTAVDILIIPKSALAAGQYGIILSNLTEIPTTLNFYQRMISSQPNLADPAVSELPAAKIETYWKEKITVRRIDQSGIIRLTITDKLRYRAEDFSTQAKKAFLESASLYYNVKEDLDIRIINGPITQEGSAVYALVIIMESAGLSMILVVLVYLATFHFFPDKNRKIGEKVEKIKFFSEVFKSQKKVNKISKKSEIGWEAVEKPYEFFAKKAPAPDNLPITQESIFEAEKSEEKPAIIREATSEEVKERLNKLLSGQL